MAVRATVARPAASSRASRPANTVGVRPPVGLPAQAFAPTREGVLQLQRTAGNRAATVAVQRHASWEHKMLGDMEPDTLQVIASGRDVAASKSKTVMAGDRAIGIDTVLHSLDQEIRRVGYFRDHAPTEGGKKGVESLVKLDTKDRIKEATKGISDEKEEEKAIQTVEDSKWDVRLVTLALSDGSSIVLTYGEMNTLADIYGSYAHHHLVHEGGWELARSDDGHFQVTPPQGRSAPPVRRRCAA